MTAIDDTKVDAYIDGRWVLGAEARRAVNNPATGSVLTEVSVTSIAQCIEAVDAAHHAFPSWSQTPPRVRGEILRKAFELMIAGADRLAELIVLENGKVMADARAEVRYAAEFFRWYAEEAVRVTGDMRRSPAGTNWIMVSHEPVGVSLLVTPWNFPAAMATRKIGPALAAGCTVVLKPAMETPLTALAIVELLQRAGVPSGVVNVVMPSPAGPAVAAMLQDKRVRAVSFTGSTEVGRIILAAAAGNITRASMELGGNAPFVVLDDADIDEAVDGLMIAKLRNGGAACTAANRILVHQSISENFVGKVTERMAALTVGPGLDASSDVGPLVTAVERDRVRALVEESVQAGARVIAQQSAIPNTDGFYFPPTILADVRADAPILRQEIFGPVAPVVTFASDDEAVALANDTDAGLIAYLYSQGLNHGLSVARRLESGMVGLNRGLVSDPAAPFGGVKHSGLGREGAHEGILEFLETKYIATRYS